MNPTTQNSLNRAASKKQIPISLDFGTLRRLPVLLVSLLCFHFTAAFCSHAAAAYKILVFSKTGTSFRHDSIPAGHAAIQQLAAANNFAVDATEDSSAFTTENLAQYRAVVFLNTIDDVLDANQKVAFENYIRAGNGWVGIHSPSLYPLSWTWYGGLVGASFKSHPHIQQATIKVADQTHPSTASLPKRWVRTDEWYDFQLNPRGRVHVLATLDEGSYSGGGMGYDHPIAWCHNYDGGRSWYTAGGHTIESYSEPLFRAHLLGGIEFAAGAKDADCGGTIDSNYQQVTLDTDADRLMDLAVAPDGRVFYIARCGRVKIYTPQTDSVDTAAQLSVFCTNYDDGLLGIALDPGFATNQWLYLFYSPSNPAPQHVSRFTVVSNSLDLGSERILLLIPTQRDQTYHAAGCLRFGPDGNLYISIGDNTNPFASGGYAPIDERADRSVWDAQRSAANANDLRGKILRIHPQPDGTYTVPAGNLFPPGTPMTRPEIYVMGCRNPFRFSVDSVTGWLYWGDVGPDASSASSAQGPKGYDEFNQTRAAGNYGWPLFIANNQPYREYDFATSTGGAYFNPASPTNNSPNNTGPQLLPPAQPAWIWYPYGPSAEFPELGNQNYRVAMAGPVYHYQPDATAPGKLPPYFDNTLFLMDITRNAVHEVKLDDNGGVLKINPFLPSYNFHNPIDIVFGHDGTMYALSYLSTNSLVRIDYIGGDRVPALQSSPSLAGPFFNEPGAVVDDVAKTISVARPTGTRFYRVRYRVPLRITDTRVIGASVVLSYE